MPNKIAPEKEQLDALFEVIEETSPDKLKAEPEAKPNLNVYKETSNDPMSVLCAPIIEKEVQVSTNTRHYISTDNPEDLRENVDQGFRTLREVASDNDARGSDRIVAAKALLESAGLLGKGSTVNVIKAENAQINNGPGPEDAKLLNAIKNMGSLLEANDAGVNIHKGGQG